MSLAARDVAWSAGGQPILAGVTLEVPPGGVLGLLGPMARASPACCGCWPGCAAG